MPRPRYYRVDPEEILADIEGMKNKECGIYFRSFLENLISENGRNKSAKRVIEATNNYLEKKRLAGSEGGKKRSSNAQAMLPSNAKAMLEEKQKINPEKTVPKRVVKKISGEHQKFIDWFVFSYEVVTGVKYVFLKKDAAAVATLLKSVKLVTLVIISCHFLTDDSPFYRDKHSLTMLLAHINNLRKDYTAEDLERYRELGIAPPEGVMFNDWDYRSAQEEEAGNVG